MPPPHLFRFSLLEPLSKVEGAGALGRRGLGPGARRGTRAGTRHECRRGPRVPEPRAPVVCGPRAGPSAARGSFQESSLSGCPGEVASESAGSSPQTGGAEAKHRLPPRATREPRLWDPPPRAPRLGAPGAPHRNAAEAARPSRRSAGSFRCHRDDL